MAQIIDLTGRITNELPMIRITKDFIVTVNNRKSVILNVQAMVREREKIDAENKRKSALEGTPYEAPDEMKDMNTALKLLIGKDNTDKLNEMDLPINEFKIVFETIMNLATGVEEAAPSK